MAELRECPFCGSSASIIRAIDNPVFHHACCDDKKAKCPLVAGLRWETSEEEAIAVWNERNNNFIVEVIRKRLHGLSYDSGYWSRGEHPRVVELDEIDDLMDEFSTDDERNDEK